MKRSKIGRPSKAPTCPARVRLSTLEAIDAWAETQADKPTRPDALEHLIEVALSVEKARTEPADSRRAEET